MSKKVLGFKKEDIEKIFYTGTKYERYKIEKRILVPVVSVEWLEKHCKDSLVNATTERTIIPEKLLSAARKEAKKK